MLTYDMRPPFSFAHFVARCRGLLNARDLRVLERVPEAAACTYTGTHPFLAGWQAREEALRNELVRVRAARMKKDAEHYMRGDKEAYTGYAPAAQRIYDDESLIRGAAQLDRMRWDAVDELVGGHYFDLYTVLSYGAKLHILARKRRIEEAHPGEEIEKVLPEAYKGRRMDKRV